MAWHNFPSGFLHGAKPEVREWLQRGGFALEKVAVVSGSFETSAPRFSFMI